MKHPPLKANAKRMLINSQKLATFEITTIAQKSGFYQPKVLMQNYITVVTPKNKLMKNLVLILLIMIIPIPSNAISVFESENEFSEFLTYYYLNPQKEKVIPSISYYTGSPIYEKADSRMQFAHSYASILKKEPSLLDELFENQTQFGTSDSKIFVLNILWLVDNNQSKGLIKKAQKLWKEETVQDIIKRIKNAESHGILKTTPRSAAHLDNLWGIFLATGSEDAVKQIISVLRLSEDGHGWEIVIGGAARWSLRSNAYQHPEVYRICKEQLECTDGTTKKLLEEIISKVDERKKRDAAQTQEIGFKKEIVVDYPEETEITEFLKFMREKLGPAVSILPAPTVTGKIKPIYLKATPEAILDKVLKVNGFSYEWDKTNNIITVYKARN